MNTFLELTWEYIINLIESGLSYYYIRTFLTPKKIPHQNLFHILWILGRFTTLSICNTLFPSSICSVVIVSIYQAVFTCILFKEKNTLCMLWGMLHLFLCLITELIAMLLLRLFDNITPNDILFGESHRFPVTTLYIIILAAFSFYIPTIPSKKALFKGTQKVFVALFVCLGIVITFCFLYLMTLIENISADLLNMLVLADFVFLNFFIALLVYIYQLALTQQENEDLQARAKLLELETAQYDNLMSTTESLRAIKHDIHHHLSTIYSLIDHNESERLTDYLNEYQTHFDLDYTAASTGNIVIDSILSVKLYHARQQHTRLDYSIALPEHFPFTDVELSALLGNLFDNALEACRLIPENERFITFQIRQQENMLLIHMENAFDGIIKETPAHQILSRKSEPNHGIGLKRVTALVEEAGGFINIRHKEQLFTVHIMMPLEDKN